MKRYEDLDGLRAIAILSVMYAHFLYDSAIGMLGVWLFVLSGYLITGILLRCRDEDRKGAPHARNLQDLLRPQSVANPSDLLSLPHRHVGRR